EGLAWMIDYEQALQAGMAITIPLVGDAARARSRVDVLLVVGVDETMTPAAVSAELSRLLAVHARTDDCAFVLQGSPTNTTESIESGWTPGTGLPVDIKRPDGFPVPRDLPGPFDGPEIPDAPVMPADDNAARFAWGLGLPDAGALRRLTHGGR